ncbi:translation initiation factor IF-2 [Roseburia sp. AF25-25LB]|uniref:translation initiation factor IF-2 n=1 Tax=Roseburia sp. AF25-25LB TaxID=2293135 RepID=UPI000E50A3F7|nr:translation initiation factor IF-2 [Roseburia sp. AF25-25LB]RHQ44939.1 translation initiation factor IF-2 [Roseburia sp. AF25-25LB]
MSKLRVYELAKELNIKPQDVLDSLKGTQYEVKTSSNSIDEDAQKLVRSKVKGAAKPAAKPAAETKPAGEAKAAGEAKSTEAPARPKKKASISAVFNPQNSKTNPGSRRQAYHTNAKTGEARRPAPAARPAQPAKTAAPKPAEVKTAEVKPAEVKATEVKAAEVKPAETKTAEVKTTETKTVQEKPVVKTEEKKTETRNFNNNRQQGDRPYNNNRPQGDRPYNNNRPQGDRPYNNNRQQGDRPYNNNRPQGDRPYNNNRPQGDRNGRGGRNGGRFDQELNRFNKEAIQAGPDDLRKESRENRDRDNTRKKQVQEHDKLGSKKQERYVNLEKNGGKKKRPAQPKPKEEDTIRSVSLPERMTIKELADKMKVQASEIIKKLFMKGQMVTVNQEIDYDSAEEIALEFNCIAEPEEKVDVIAELLKEDEEREEDLVPRPPVVCVMGHVDHGKTSLLDAIRNTHVTDREAGGITQHIGAYVVSINGQKITFLDTPGHEAFTAMRLRGAKSTDIAILVVAADDGVMPQTVEAINHAKAAGIEIVVAINKIDKPNANIDRVKQELSEYELIPEDWGGSTIFVPVSAHTHEGIDQLLEMLLLTAEVSELKANPKRKARGVIIEAQLDKGRGAVATVLVQKGTLTVGEPIACGSAYGKVRAMIDDKGRRVKEAGPSMPVEILGLSSVPDAGETFVACDSEKDARNFAETYISEGKAKLLEETRSRMSLDDLFSQIQSGDVKELDIIVKADVQGSVEAVKQSLVKLSNDEVVVKIIHGGVGAINESDVTLASASNAIIIGFNVRPDPTAKVTAENEGVDIRLYKVIYNAIEDVEAAMKGMLDPVYEEKVIGHAEVRQIFKASGVGNIAGSYVLDGNFERGCKVRITREGTQIFEGNLASLKRFKDDVKEVKAGYECGLVFEGFNDIAELDQVEAYKMVEVAR